MPWHVTPFEDRLALAGELRLDDAARVWTALRRHAKAHHEGRLDLDLSAVEAMDASVLALLVDLRASLIARGVACELIAIPATLAPIVHLHGGDRAPAPRVAATRPGGLASIGGAVRQVVTRGRDLVGFLGALALATGRTIRHPSTLSWRTLPELIARAGTDGIAIVVLLNFLLGFVIAFQSARQLELYGANIYVADIVGISVTRELAPLMTAIIIAGRSGAAYAAELGTMRVSDEIDALKSMGVAPIPHLVLPRIWTLALVAPLLVLVGDIAGVLGGLVVARSLDVSPSGYLTEIRNVVLLSDVWTGLVKSAAFGAVVGFIGCYQGFSTRGAAAGVGRGTTATVVFSLFAIVALDALFTILFRAVNV